MDGRAPGRPMLDLRPMLGRSRVRTEMFWVSRAVVVGSKAVRRVKELGTKRIVVSDIAMVSS